MIEITVDEQVLADIGKGFSVPVQPKLLAKLQQIIAQPDPQLNEVAELIMQDVAVSATILKTINSPLYGLARSMSDIKKSVRYIGLNGIYSLVTGCLLKQSFQQNDCSIDLDDFWVTAHQIANVAMAIGKQTKHRISSEKLFSIGFFHDCGIPIMAIKYQRYQATLNFALNNPHTPLTTLEDKIFNVNHATIGYYVASSWRLPKDICQLILRHHDRHLLDSLDQSEFQLAFAILKLAENIIEQHKYFRDITDWHYLAEPIFTLLDFDEDDYRDLCDDINEQLLMTRG